MKKKILLLVAAFLVFSSLQAQVTQINSNKSLQFQHLLTSNKAIFVSEIDQHLWVTDGTLAGTVQLSPDISYKEGFGSMIPLDGKFIFSGTTPSAGTELFITDGTAGGTVLLKDINTGNGSSSPDDYGGVFNGFIYFTAERPAEGRELWRTNGTSVGTTFVKDIVPGTGGSNYPGAYHIFSSGTYLLMMARTPSSGVELWRSDGTGTGTVLLKDINPGADSPGVKVFIPFNNLVFFSANDGSHGNELWKTDGTPSGTVLLKDINTGTGSSTTIDLFGFSFPLFISFHVFNNRAFFNATDGSSTGQVWGTDGSAANTSLLKNIIDGTDMTTVSLLDAVDLSAKFIFPVADGTSRSELWESDGTPGGTVLFKSYSPLNDGELPLLFVPYNAGFVSGGINQQLFQGNKFFFEAGTATQGNELWISDGVLANTTIVKNINPGELDGIDLTKVSYLYTSAGLFFPADNGTNGNELWKSDGSLAGTTMVADLVTGLGGSDPSLVFFIVNNKILFTANNGDDPVNTDLYAVDGNFSPVPVKLSRFTVAASGEDAILQWQTQQEINSRDFTIQRSVNGRDFENIGSIAASGNSATGKAYTYFDKDILKRKMPVLFYRLLMVDTDGKGTYSTIITLQTASTGMDVQLLNNPVKDNIFLQLNGINTDAQFMISDMTGRTVRSGKLAMANGLVSISTGILPHGEYLLLIITGSESKTIRFIK